MISIRKTLGLINQLERDWPDLFIKSILFTILLLLLFPYLNLANNSDEILQSKINILTIAFLECS